MAIDTRSIRTRRWCDPAEPGDGLRVLVCRYRPRGLRKTDETWDVWIPALGPTRELHADFYGRNGPPIGWSEYRKRYLSEMKAQRPKIAELAARVAAGDTITLLCSSACLDPAHCHRTLLADLVTRASKPSASATRGAPARRTDRRSPRAAPPRGSRPRR